jgi:short-chain Z-isoprenyl diphosphate synthase
MAAGRRSGVGLKNLIYYLYERRLLASVRQGRLPQHVGLILDGNRRYARAKNLPTITDGHRKGAEKLDEVLRWCGDLNIRTVTIWVFSTENQQRTPGEVEELMEVIENKIEEMAQDPLIRELQMRIRAVGQIGNLPPHVRDTIRKAEESTRKYDRFFLNIAVAYGGRQEIADAFKKLLAEKAGSGLSPAEIAASISPEEISRHMYTYDVPDPDLIIRTSGEVRLSGFLLWQSAYSEFYFCDVNWPAFRKIDFLRAIRSYQQRERRFGH